MRKQKLFLRTSIYYFGYTCVYALPSLSLIQFTVHFLIKLQNNITCLWCKIAILEYNMHVTDISVKGIAQCYTVLYDANAKPLFQSHHLHLQVT
jgi:hypothetical protein